MPRRRQPVPLFGRTYGELRSRFRWRLPETFNIGTACTEAQPARRVALIHLPAGGGEQRYTFGDLARLSNRAANLFQGLGLQPGDRAAVVLPQVPEAALAHLGAFKAGLVSLPLSSLFGPEALRYRLADSGAALVVTDGAGAERIAALQGLPDLRWILNVEDGPRADPRVRSFWLLLAEASDRFLAAPSTPDDPCLVIYTSGTTGPPKGVLHGHRVLLGQTPGFRLVHELAPKPGDLVWTPADWAWIGGLVNTLLIAWSQGLPVVGTPRRGFDPDWALRLLAGQGIRNVFLPTTALRLMLQCEVPPGIRLRSLMTGGEAQEEWLLGAVREAFGITMNEAYGQTEADFVVGHCASRWPVPAGSMGRALPGHDVVLLDAEGRPAAPGEAGEVAVRTPDPTVMLRYWNRPDATAAKFSGPWLKTGDLARLDEDGCFWFEARVDDVIKSAGYRIGPSEVEECLLREDGVVNVAVVGRPDPVRGQVVKAYIQLREGAEASADLEERLRSRVRRELAAYQYPRVIEFLPQLPLTPSGKVDRGELRRHAAAHVASLAGQADH